MQQPDVEKVCEELRELIGLGPGENDGALRRVHAVLSRMQADPDAGSYVREKIIDTQASFEEWFSARKWTKYGGAGERLKSHLYADVSKLEGAWRTG